MHAYSNMRFERARLKVARCVSAERARSSAIVPTLALTTARKQQRRLVFHRYLAQSPIQTVDDGEKKARGAAAGPFPLCVCARARSRFCRSQGATRYKKPQTRIGVFEAIRKK
jgi:hypothetical protein